MLVVYSDYYPLHLLLERYVHLSQCWWAVMYCEVIPWPPSLLERTSTSQLAIGDIFIKAIFKSDKRGPDDVGDGIVLGIECCYGYPYQNNMERPSYVRQNYGFTSVGSQEKRDILPPESMWDRNSPDTLILSYSRSKHKTHLKESVRYT